MGPENRTVTSKDNFLRVNLIGDFVGYSNIPTFEDFYLAIPRDVWFAHLYDHEISKISDNASLFFAFFLFQCVPQKSLLVADLVTAQW